jgi:hypothetical protein
LEGLKPSKRYTTALSPKQLGKKKTFQRAQNLIFDFFLQKKNQKSNFALSAPLFSARYFPNYLGRKAIVILHSLKKGKTISLVCTASEFDDSDLFGFCGSRRDESQCSSKN